MNLTLLDLIDEYLAILFQQCQSIQKMISFFLIKDKYFLMTLKISLEMKALAKTLLKSQSSYSFEKQRLLCLNGFALFSKRRMFH